MEGYMQILCNLYNGLGLLEFGSHGGPGANALWILRNHYMLIVYTYSTFTQRITSNKSMPLLSDCCKSVFYYVVCSKGFFSFADSFSVNGKQRIWKILLKRIRL
jgi:hypothetical protein